MSKHTPGPWENNGMHGREVWARCFTGELKAIVDRVRGGSPEEAHANARLIAAAPELLEALKECSDRLKIHMKHTEDLVADMKAQKAIAKAEGK